ncbi:MAG: hypothetical protein Q9166_006524 [cf. Caloplaca sp. 2 TL-2023]
MAAASMPFLTASEKVRMGSFGLKRKPAARLDLGPYQYTALEINQIRLLSISIEQATGVLVCRFNIRDLASSIGTYKAISYCWGNPTPTSRILCENGQSLQLTNSAAEILTHVISQDPKECFWIDQLCINQADPIEKSAQVLLMGQIYSSTKQVVAWLGRGDGESEKAFAFTEMLSREIDGMRQKGLQPSLEPLMSVPAVRIRNIPSQIQVERKWSALSHILRNPWFERAWVMQEVIMACEKTSESISMDQRVLLRFEKCIIGFDMLAEVLRILDSDHLLPNLVYDRQANDGTNEHGVDPPGVSAIRLFETFRDYRSRNTPVSLHHALYRTWHSKATNDRDKLYAILGFCDNNVTDAGLRPEYESTVEDIYVAWAATLLESTEDYPILIHMAGIGHQRSHTALPSWVPDFSTSSSVVGLRSEATRGAQNLTYRASGSIEKIDFIIDRLPPSMRFQGIQIDTIEVVWAYPSSSKSRRWYKFLKQLSLTSEKDFWSSLVQRLEKIEDFLMTSSSALEDNGAHAKEVLWQTLVGDYKIDDAATKSDISQAFESWYQSARELAGEDRSGLVASQTRKAEFYNQIQSFEDQSSVASQDLPIFGTAQRRLLGYGPTKLMAGNTLCIINGAVTPFLLREVTNDAEDCQSDERRWRLVGSCFVHGLMYGEGLEMGEMKEFLVI